MLNENIGVTDNPIVSMSEDLFNVKPYVMGLCSFINTCETPMTISIQGDWGSGKTSMMNMIRENVQGNIWPIWFNTWQFSQFHMGNALAFSMMDVLIKGLDGNKNILKKVAKGFFGLVRTATVVATDVAVGGKPADLLDDVMAGNKEVDVASEIMSLKDNFQQMVNEKLTKEKRDRVVVFVDDLDRLEPAKAVELLEVLKLFLDCNNCVFILAVDYEVVTTGIRQKYGENVSEQKGRNFFDKIIQLPFKMPVAHYDVKKYVAEMMQKMKIRVTERDINLFASLIRTSIGFNPRAMKRLFNTYQLLDLVSRGTVENISNEIRQRVLFMVVCLQTGFEEFYMYLVTSECDANMLQSFVTKDTEESSLNDVFDDALPVKVVEEKKRRIRAFLPYMIEALQIDDDKNISEEEADNFRNILKSSSITSVNNIETLDLESQVWRKRNFCKDMMKNVVNDLKNLQEFHVKIPRKRDENGMLPTRVEAEATIDTEQGIVCCLNVSTEWEEDDTIAVSLAIYRADATKIRDFHNILGENPLKMKNPVWQDWGAYQYNRMLSISKNDPTAEQQIVTLMKNAVTVLMA